jgi:hypothetical protein
VSIFRRNPISPAKNSKPNPGTRQHYRSWGTVGVGEYVWASPVFCAQNAVLLQLVRQSLANIPTLYSDMPEVVSFVGRNKEHIENYALNQVQCVATALAYPDEALDHDQFQAVMKSFINELVSFACNRGEFWLESIWLDLVNLINAVEERLDAEREIELAHWAAESVMLALQVVLVSNKVRYAELRAKNEEFRQIAIGKL